MSDMECGYSRDLFVQWASNPKNSIILTSRTAPGCLTHTLVSNLKLPSVDLEVKAMCQYKGRYAHCICSPAIPYKQPLSGGLERLNLDILRTETLIAVLHWALLFSSMY